MKWQRAAAAAMVTALWISGVFGLQKANAGADDIPFTDLSGAYGKNEIASLYKNHIMMGTSPTLFSPHKPITRAESLTVLVRLLKLEPVQGAIPAFSDVSTNRWYYSNVQAAAYIGITEGTGSGGFGPEQPLTRQEAAVWLIRGLKQQPSAAGMGTPDFHDAGEIASWAAPSVNVAHTLGLLKGDNGKFRPNDLITREETAVLMARVLQTRNWSSEINRTSDTGIQLGWQYDQTTTQFEQSVMNSTANTLSPRWLFLEKSGAISSSIDRSLVTWAGQHNKQVWAMLGNRFDADVTHQVLSDKARSATVVSQLGDLVRKYGLNGINLDFENIYPQDKAGLTLFIQNLSTRLHTENAVLSVCVSPDLGTDWTEAFDYTALGKAADYMVLMGYDEHWGGGAVPGSVASLPWQQNGLDTIQRRVPSNKVILAVPFYTRDWTLNRDGSAASSTDISITEQNKLISKYSLKPKWDNGIQQYVASYLLGSQQHRIWMEDGRSLTRKYLLGASRHIAGYAYWYVGGENPEVWAALRNAGRFSGYQF